MIDPVFGDITFNNGQGWEGVYALTFLGSVVDVRLSFWADTAEEPIDPIQRDAMRLFDSRRDELCAKAEDAIYELYRERAPELRQQFGSTADKLMPIIESKRELGLTVTPTTIFIVEPLLTSDRVVGILYNCTWEPELGLAVKIVNENVDEVGPQDIVL